MFTSPVQTLSASKPRSIKTARGSSVVGTDPAPKQKAVPKEKPKATKAKAKKKS